jgi:voltage-gated potassium channel
VRYYVYLLNPLYLFELPKRLLVMVLIPTALVLIGTLGYWLIEPKYTLFDSLYMTVITITTVGYEEVHKLSTAGRWFTMFLLFWGVFTLFYTASEILRIVISGEMADILGRQVMLRSLEEMNNHLIVCGYGRMGQRVCEEFARQQIPFVVIDRNTDLPATFDVKGGIPLVGDATSDELLLKAGVKRARALVTVVASDADNLYITMSARLLNEKLYIVARAEEEPAAQKLTRAGANRVVSPYVIGGLRVASAVLRPAVVDFIELATRTEHMDLQIEEATIQPGSRLQGATLQASKVRQDLNVIIVAIKKKGGHMLFNPPSDAVMEAGDTLIALGHRQQLDQLETLAGQKE